MTVPWLFAVVVAAPATVGLMYGVAAKASGRAISTRLLVFEVGALLFLIFGWIYLAAVAPGN
jgi:xanthine/uracil permease